jgi:polar amino acid transport system permease protein
VSGRPASWSPWPSGWDARQRSAATLACGALALVLTMWGLAVPLSWAPDPIGPNAAAFAEGARVTLWLTVVSGSVGVVLGLAAALAKRSRWWLLRQVAGTYIWVMRGTPLLVQVLFVYFALPELLPFLKLDDFAAACVALAFNVGAYNAEAFRAGLQAVPRGQLLAAWALGMGPWTAFRHVVAPQAFRIALPPLVNNVVALLKDSSLAYAVGVVELTNVGNRVQAATFKPTQTLLTTALVYLLLTTLLTWMSDALERGMAADPHR